MNVKMQTKTWWENLLNKSVDSNKLERWLVKLQATELAARDRFSDFANSYCKEGSREYLTFKLLAEQENKHALLLEGMLNTYFKGGNFTPEASKYWVEVSKCVKDKETAAAAGHFAEDLALQRMEVIVEHPKTPKYIRDIFSEIVKDEEMHTRVLKKIAGKHGVEQVIDCHSKGLEVLKLKLKKSFKQELS